MPLYLVTSKELMDRQAKMLELCKTALSSRKSVLVLTDQHMADCFRALLGARYPMLTYLPHTLIVESVKSRRVSAAISEVVECLTFCKVVIIDEMVYSHESQLQAVQCLADRFDIDIYVTKHQDIPDTWVVPYGEKFYNKNYNH